MKTPRNEYPRPQLVRDSYINLNGHWNFEIDNALSGIEHEFYKRDSLQNTILVPFCPESELSGIQNTDFMNCVWYRRDLEIPRPDTGKRAILHFGAVDYHAILYINGNKVGEHKGGYTSFSFDITDYLMESNNYITLCVFDNLRTANQPSGKQCHQLKSYGCYYTRITGIWQTVWLEFVDACHVVNIKPISNIDIPAVLLEIKLSAAFSGCTVSARALWEGKEVGFAESKAYSQVVHLSLPLSEKHLWQVGEGNLYDLKLTLTKDGTVCDSVNSYFGLRTVTLDGRAFKINGETVFGRWVLDQGYYPDGLYTAPTDEALKNDILYGQALGFNGARLHEKVFEPRFLYWADKLGYIVWGEQANWGLDVTEAGQVQYFLPEWLEAVERDFAHPSIIGWIPFNETWDRNNRKQDDSVIRLVYLATKAADPTRPVIDASGNFHVETDIFDVHDYEQDPQAFASHYVKMTEGIMEDTTYLNPALKDRQKYDGVSPAFVSEYGGMRWDENNSESWGYGTAPKTPEEFINRYQGLTDTLLDNPYMLGFCYTQLYDIEQERNGLLTYDRKFKFNPELFKAINSRTAVIEKLDVQENK